MVRAFAFRCACHIDNPHHSLSELVQDSINGLVFENASQLAGHLEVGLILPVTSMNTDHAS